MTRDDCKALADGLRGLSGSTAIEPETAIIYIAIWDDDGTPNAQAYKTREAAERDYPGAGSDPSIVTIVQSTVQN